MSLNNYDTADQRHVDDNPLTIIRCPLCRGSGAIECKKKDGQLNIACLFSTPTQAEEKCSCCDGKGWVSKSQMSKSKFCKVM